MNLISMGDSDFLCFLIHWRMECSSVSAADWASGGERHSKVDVSARWIRQSLMYCSYSMVQGPSPLSASGKRRLLSVRSFLRTVDWKGRMFGRAHCARKSDFKRCENLFNLASTQGGM